ncbi:MAG: LuxR C-terminal-related transcriptional regulator [Candidatus Limnocylindrales bacterium]
MSTHSAQMDHLDRGREAYEGLEWSTAFESLSEADRLQRLDLDDLERLAIAASMLGREEVLPVTERVHREARRAGKVRQAVRAAFWLGMELGDRGEWSRAGGWFAKAARELDESGLDAVERGYLLLPRGIQSVAEGDAEAGLATYDEVIAIGERFADADLVTLGRVGRGEAMIAMGDARRGMTQLDEAMVAVIGDEVAPIIAGLVYCSVITACQATFDVRRAQEWTAALTTWCERQPDMVPFRGQCLLSRAQLMQLRGRWNDAEREAWLASERLQAQRMDRDTGEAIYQQAQIRRLRGRFAEAEGAYRRASELGRSPEPGLALLRLAQGRVETAEAMIHRALGEAKDRPGRAWLLEAAVEIALATGNVDAARHAAMELGSIASAFGAPFLEAVAWRAEGAVLLASDDADGALVVLRRSLGAWQGLDAPFEAARVRVLIAQACRELGDADGSAMEADHARRVFRELGAGPDLGRAEALLAQGVDRAPGGLTRRELDVLRLVASGGTNRAIAAELVLSEKTVARHLSNIYTKLAISSRASATAYAYEHGLAAGNLPAVAPSSSDRPDTSGPPE